jgi:uncharacterized repeat protein (TIGR01451 family)
VEGGEVRFDLGELAAGTGVQVLVVARADELGASTNQVSVSAAEADPAPANNRAEAVRLVKLQADMQVTLSVVTNTVLTGQEIRFEIGVTNGGPHDAVGVVIEDRLPAGLSLVAVETGPWSWTHDLGVVRFDLGMFAPGTEARLGVVVRAEAEGAWTNRVRVSTGSLDPAATNNEAVLAGTVLPFARFAWTVSATPEPVMVGDHLRYRIRVTNPAPYAIADVRLVDALPAELSFVSASVSPSGNWSQDGNVVVFDLGELPQSGGAEATLVVTPTTAGLITNTFALSSAFLDPAEPVQKAVAVSRGVAEPPLTVEHSGKRLVLSWPVVAVGYVLQSTDHLNPPVRWVDDQNPKVIVGDRVTVSLKIVGSEWYYRLVKP